jgi:hypothetical protein
MPTWYLKYQLGISNSNLVSQMPTLWYLKYQHFAISNTNTLLSQIPSLVSQIPSLVSKIPSLVSQMPTWYLKYQIWYFQYIFGISNTNLPHGIAKVLAAKKNQYFFNTFFLIFC